MLIHFTWRLSRFAGLAVGCVFILTAVHRDSLLYSIKSEHYDSPTQATNPLYYDAE